MGPLFEIFIRLYEEGDRYVLYQENCEYEISYRMLIEARKNNNLLENSYEVTSNGMVDLKPKELLSVVYPSLDTLLRMNGKEIDDRQEIFNVLYFGNSKTLTVYRGNLEWLSESVGAVAPPFDPRDVGEGIFSFVKESLRSEEIMEILKNPDYAGVSIDFVQEFPAGEEAGLEDSLVKLIDVYKQRDLGSGRY